MEELSPYSHLETPNLHGYLQSHEGEFRLTACRMERHYLKGRPGTPTGSGRVNIGRFGQT